MIFAFFEEIDGPSGLARRPGTGGGNGFLFGRRPRARAEPGCRRAPDFAIGRTLWGPALSPDDAKTQPDRRRPDAARPGPSGAGRRRWTGSGSRRAPRLAGRAGAGW